VIQELVALGAIKSEVLDPGTGPGHHAIYFASKGLSANGVDASLAAIEGAKQNACDAWVSVDFHVADATKLDGFENRFDTVADSAFFHRLSSDKLLQLSYKGAAPRDKGRCATLHVGVRPSGRQRFQHAALYPRSHFPPIASRAGLKDGSPGFLTTSSPRPFGRSWPWAIAQPALAVSSLRMLSHVCSVPLEGRNGKRIEGESPMNGEVMTRRFGTAIVCGAGLAGLAATRALSDSFDRVIIIERDELHDAAEPRGGVPQGRQVHTLLPGGRAALDEMLPGLSDDMIGHSAVRTDITADVKQFHIDSWVPRFPSDLWSTLSSRSLLESVVRRRVVGLPNAQTFTRLMPSREVAQ
jgi:Methyltransferase domain